MCEYLLRTKIWQFVWIKGEWCEMRITFKNNVEFVQLGLKI